MELLNPSWLWAAPVVLGVLLYAYAKRGSAQELPASSTMFLKQLSTSAATRRLPIIPPRFLFDLLISLLLIFALVGLLNKSSSTRVAIVIDNSLSMGARNGDGTSLDKAVKLAERAAALSYSDASIQVFLTSPVPRSFGADRLDKSSLKQILQDIEVGYSDDNIEAAISFAASTDAFDAIEVFTDRPVGQNLVNENLQLHSVSNSISLSKNNFSIQGLNRSAYDAKVRVSSFSDTSAELKVAAKSLTGGGSFSRSIKLEPSETSDVIFPIKLEDGPMSVSISQESGKDSDLDSLLLDNTVYLGLPNSSEDILLVGKFSPESLNLNTIESLSIGWRKPQEYSQAEKPKVYIFHNWAPPKLPSVPSMFVNDFSGLKVDKQTWEEGKNLSHWDGSHELLKYLSLPYVRLKKASFAKAPKWSQSLLEISGKTIVFAGERLGVRYAYIGFEVFPLRGVFSAVPSIAFLNTMNWLGNDTSSISHRAYGIVSLRSVPKKVSYIGPIEEDLRLIDENKYVLKAPGIVKETYASSSKYQAVNFYSEKESNLKSQQLVAAQAITKGEDDNSGELLTTTLLKYALWLALLGSLLFIIKLPKLWGRTA